MQGNKKNIAYLIIIIIIIIIIKTEILGTTTYFNVNFLLVRNWRKTGNLIPATRLNNKMYLHQHHLGYYVETIKNIYHWKFKESK